MESTDIKKLLIGCADFISPYDDGGNSATIIIKDLDEAINSLSNSEGSDTINCEGNVARKAIEIVKSHWSFDNAQQHTHSWHDKQDCLEHLGELVEQETLDNIQPSNKQSITDKEIFLGKLLKHCIENRNFLKNSDSSSDRSCGEIYQEIRTMIDDHYLITKPSKEKEEKERDKTICLMCRGKKEYNNHSCCEDCGGLSV